MVTSPNPTNGDGKGSEVKQELDELHDLDDSDERGLGTSDDEDDLQPEPVPAALPDLP